MPRVDLRLGDDLHARLVSAARAERRSLNAMVGLLLERVLGEGEPWVGDAALGAAPGSVSGGLARASGASPSPSPRDGPPSLTGDATAPPGGVGGLLPRPAHPSPAPAGRSFRPDPKPSKDKR